MTSDETGDLRTIGAIEHAGPQTIVVDHGRPGWAHLAVTRSGPYDRGAYQRANRLVGNSAETAVLEVLLGPIRLRFDAAATLAVTGVLATMRVHWADRVRSLDCESTLTVPAGSTVEVASFSRGLHAYVAIRGGWACAPTLGSRSTDTLSGLGPAQVRDGDPLVIHTRTQSFPQHDANIAAFHLRGNVDGPLPLRLLPAPRTSRHRSLHQQLLERAWLVSPDSDRIGMRLLPADPQGSAPPLQDRASFAQAPSEPLVRGAVQVPPDGRPVIMGPDHPTTGGYPVVGVVVEHDSDALAQLRPGDPLRFVDVRM